jgi:anti-sigma factor RsiW
MEAKMTCEEAQELITALVDRELADPERSSLEAHLVDCVGCRRTLEDERALKQAVQETGQRIYAPAELRRRILSDQRIFPAETPSMRSWYDYMRPLPISVSVAALVLVLLAVAFPTLVYLRSGSEPIAVAALETYDRFVRGEVPVRRAESAEEMVDQLTRTVGGQFHPMGYDLTALGLRPVSGLVREFNGRKVLIAIYQGHGGTLFCYTFLGSEVDAPPNAARFFDAGKGMNFYAFSRGTTNAVLHREGQVICILVAEMPTEELLAVAKSKAKAS